MRPTLARRHRRLIAAAALLALIAGCAALPTAPGPAGTPGARGATGTSITVTPLDGPDAPAPAVTRVSTSRAIVGIIGGTLHLGRFTLVVPPGAVRGNATITMTLPDPNGPECDLDILPRSANGFLIPVLLSCDCKGIPSITDPLLLSMGWFDPAKQTWVKVPGVQVNVLQKIVLAPLPHFSKYQVIYGSRAGW